MTDALVPVDVEALTALPLGEQVDALGAAYRGCDGRRRGGRLSASSARLSEREASIAAAYRSAKPPPRVDRVRRAGRRVKRSWCRSRPFP